MTNTPKNRRTAPYWRRTALAASLLALSGAAAAAAPGYVTSAGGNLPVTNGAGQCWTSGAWSPANAMAPCHVMTTVSAAPVPVVTAAPQPAPAPAPAPVAAAPIAPAAPVLQRITLSTDVLFRFNSAELRPGANEKLDEIAQTMQGAEVDRIVAMGHADRIASEQYNEELSQKRADAVKGYLVQKGIAPERIETRGLGESQPVTECKGMGPERASNRKLVSCLQPDRRVEIEVLGHREVAAGEAPSTTGAGSSGATGSSMNPSSR